MENCFQDQAGLVQMVGCSIWVMQRTNNFMRVTSDVFRPYIDAFVIVYLDI
jgi:hypothetical protein